MNKPITILREEYVNKIVTVSNESALPAFVKLDVLEKVCEQLRKLAREEYAKDVSEYQNASADEERKEGEDA